MSQRTVPQLRFYNSTYKSEAISFLSRYQEISREKATQLMNNFPSVIVSTRDYPEDVVSTVYTALKNHKCTVLYRDIIEEKRVCQKYWHTLSFLFQLSSNTQFLAEY